jgi:hypothetical protein
MPINANAKIGFWTGIGVLSALLVWNILATRIPSIKQFTG